MLSRQKDQISKFTNYRSLDLQNKIYQLKTLRLIKELPIVNYPLSILELGSADDSFLKLVCQKINGSGRGLDITKGDDLEKPLKEKSNTYDLVIALEIIEHLFDTDQFLKQIHRVLRPGGYLVISTPNLASLPNRTKLLLGLYPKYLEYSRTGAGHIHLYTLPILRNQIVNSQFSLINYTSPNLLCPFITKPWFPTILREFFMFLGDLFPALGSHLIIVARRGGSPYPPAKT